MAKTNEKIRIVGEYRPSGRDSCRAESSIVRAFHPDGETETNRYEAPEAGKQRHDRRGRKRLRYARLGATG